MGKTVQKTVPKAKPSKPQQVKKQRVKDEPKKKDSIKPKAKVKAEAKTHNEGPSPDMTLEQKIVAFRKIIVDQKASGGDINAKALLKQWFSDGEMSTLWGRLNRFMKGHASKASKDEWAAVGSKGHREGKVAIKNNTLALMLAFPDTWEQQFVAESTRIEESKAKGSKTKLYYRGELEQIHGIAECDDFLNKGKYEECVDSDGDVCYKKKQKFETNAKTLTKTAETKSQSRAEKEQCDALVEQMAGWFETEGEAILDDGGRGLNKKPAAAIFNTPKKGKGNKTPAALVEPDGPEPDGTEPEEKPKKTPIQEGRAKASSMANKMANASAKLLGVAAKTKKDQLTAPLLSSINDCRKVLEQKRTTLLQLATSPKSTYPELKAGTLAGAKAVQDSTDYAKLAKPFSKK